MEHPFRVDEIDGVANLEKNPLESPVVSCKAIAPFRDVGPQVTPRAVVHDEEHLFTVGEEKRLVKGDDVWV